MRFVLITRPDLEETNTVFQAACAARGLAFTEVHAGSVGAADLSGDGPRLIYCAATDWASRLIEKLLQRPGDALLHDPNFVCDHQPILLARAGLPMAKAVYVPDVDRLADQVAWLGGYPVVVKRPGGEGGQGITLASTLEDLQRQLAQPDGHAAMLEAFVPHERCWRVCVLDGAVLSAHASVAAANDFRTNAAGGFVDADAVLPPEAGDIAIRAVEALRLAFGGVDLMERPDGALILAEVNFPCFFADRMAHGGTDIAGAIVAHLHRKAATAA